jgi:hypothetical protein
MVGHRARQQHLDLTALRRLGEAVREDVIGQHEGVADRALGDLDGGDHVDGRADLRVGLEPALALLLAAVLLVEPARVGVRVEPRRGETGTRLISESGYQRRGPRRRQYSYRALSRYMHAP